MVSFLSFHFVIFTLKKNVLFDLFTAHLNYNFFIILLPYILNDTNEHTGEKPSQYNMSFFTNIFLCKTTDDMHWGVFLKMEEII